MVAQNYWSRALAKSHRRFDPLARKCGCATYPFFCPVKWGFSGPFSRRTFVRARNATFCGTRAMPKVTENCRFLPILPRLSPLSRRMPFFRPKNPPGNLLRSPSFFYPLSSLYFILPCKTAFVNTFFSYFNFFCIFCLNKSNTAPDSAPPPKHTLFFRPLPPPIITMLCRCRQSGGCTP